MVSQTITKFLSIALSVISLARDEIRERALISFFLPFIQANLFPRLYYIAKEGRGGDEKPI